MEIFEDIDFDSLRERMWKEYKEWQNKVENFAIKELDNFDLINRIIRDLDKDSWIDDETLAYHEDRYNFTLSEFNLFASVITETGLELMASGEDVYFPTVIFPISYNGKIYTLTEVFGQGTVSIFEESSEPEYKDKAIPYKEVLNRIIKERV